MVDGLIDGSPQLHKMQIFLRFSKNKGVTVMDFQFPFLN